MKEFYTILTFSQNNKCNHQNESGAWEEGEKKDWEQQQKSNIQQNSNLTLSFAKHRKRKFR